jgi:hypothetical protein
MSNKLLNCLGILLIGTTVHEDIDCSYNNVAEVEGTNFKFAPPSVQEDYKICQKSM